MDTKQNWLANFKAVVASEIATAGGKASDGYRAVAARTGLGYDYIYQIYTDKPSHNPKRPSIDVMSVIARVYGEGRDKNWINLPPESSIFTYPSHSGNSSGKTPLQPAAVVFDANVRALDTPAVPRISWVQAGMWDQVQDSFRADDALAWVHPTNSKPSGKAYALLVEGPSMTSPFPEADRSFPSGTTIIVDPLVPVQAGDFVIAKDAQTKQATFKQLITDGGRWYLKPLNPTFPTLEIDDPNARVIGRVVEFQGPGGKL